MTKTVLFRQPDGRIHSFSASRVSQFGWFDFTTHTYRDFRVLSRAAGESGVDQTFFEVCMDEPLTVVRTLKPLRGLHKHLFNRLTHFTDDPALSQNTDLFDYYVYDAGRLRALDRFYSEI